MGFWDKFKLSASDPSSPPPKLSLVPLIALVFYSVSGGPFGVEDSVGAGGPLLAILGFLILPFFWSVPEALVTAELSTAFPANGGYVLWIREAFGPFWGFQGGFWKWISGVIDNALYPVLFLDYLSPTFPTLASGLTRGVSIFGITLGLTFLNYRGLAVVGFTAVCLAIFSLAPFAVMGLLALPKLEPRRWTSAHLGRVNWKNYLNNLFWNLNFWDKSSTLAGEVEDPSKTFPRALYISIFVVVASYLVPILAGTGALELDQSRWVDGYFSTIAFAIGGSWLRIWVQLAAALSNMGLFEAEMSSDSFQLLGMAEMGMLPKFLARRSRHGTPVWGIAFSALGIVMLSWMSFAEIIELLNFLYSVGMLLELAAFVALRVRRPDIPRPYKAPVGDRLGCVLVCVPPAALLVFVMSFASLRVVVVSASVIVVGLGLYWGLEAAKAHKWLEFIRGSPLPGEASSGLLEPGQ
ncbi:probable polyamine transporter At3g19553 [Selaginella moellendorffii]|nr:probable polyamine transporter At3g19553 [Selaginella moellendorffii]|eukprot:XP_002986451.2 probable polyamine transporter At3g19553 [Selaginella moellendorffii]